MGVRERRQLERRHAAAAVVQRQYRLYVLAGSAARLAAQIKAQIEAARWQEAATRLQRAYRYRFFRRAVAVARIQRAYRVHLAR